MAWAEKFNDFMDLDLPTRGEPKLYYTQTFTNTDGNGGRFRSKYRSLSSSSNCGQKDKNFKPMGARSTSRECSSPSRSRSRVNSEYRTLRKSGSRSELRNVSFNQELHGNSGQIIDISSSSPTVTIVGVIIAKAGPKSIIPKKGSGNERHLISLTVRDAPMSFINVSCWGNIDYAKHIDSITSIGDVVEIKQAQVQSKPGKNDEKFKPWTPSSCQLNVSENQGCVSSYSGYDLANFANLVYLPPRASNDFYTLDEINAAGMNLQEEHVNLMAVVKKIWPKKSITTKRGQKTCKVDIILFDETCLAFDLTLWDSFVDLSDRWVPMETVIFASDVKIIFNDFKSAMVAYSDSKTIFTMDPDTPESKRLSQFNKTHNMASGIDDLGIFCNESQDPDVSSITNVLTIQNAKDLQSERDFHGKIAYGVLYACLTSFDVDGEDKTCVRNICPSCWRTVVKDSGFVCTNSNCLGGDPLSNSRIGIEYNISVSLTDHSGTLSFCHLQPIVAKELTGYEARDFIGLTTFQRTAIKWNFLFERVKATLKVKGGDGKNGKSFVNVLAMTKEVPGQTML